jgi:hypothetical protein
MITSGRPAPPCARTLPAAAELFVVTSCVAPSAATAIGRAAIEDRRNRMLWTVAISNQQSKISNQQFIDQSAERSAVAGLTRVARRAGRYDASSAVARSSTVTVANVVGSTGPTP